MTNLYLKLINKTTKKGHFLQKDGKKKGSFIKSNSTKKKKKTFTTNTQMKMQVGLGRAIMNEPRPISASGLKKIIKE